MAVDTRRDDIRTRALQDLRRFEVVMEGHFDYGNGYHGRLYLNPHQLFRYPSTIWRVAQDLIDVLPPGVADRVTVVAGPATGGALLLAADVLARSLMAPQELPVGVLTAILGGGYLLRLLHRQGARA